MIIIKEKPRPYKIRSSARGEDNEKKNVAERVFCLDEYLLVKEELIKMTGKTYSLGQMNHLKHCNKLKWSVVDRYKSGVPKRVYVELKRFGKWETNT